MMIIWRQHAVTTFGLSNRVCTWALSISELASLLLDASNVIEVLCVESLFSHWRNEEWSVSVNQNTLLCSHHSLCAFHSLPVYVISHMHWRSNNRASAFRKLYCKNFILLCILQTVFKWTMTFSLYCWKPWICLHCVSQDFIPPLL